MEKTCNALAVKLIIGLITQDISLFKKAKKILCRKFGSVDLTSEIFDFDKTDYYEKEMGKSLKKQFLSFQRLISAERLVNIKHYTNSLEKKLSKKPFTPHPVQKGRTLLFRLRKGSVQKGRTLLFHLRKGPVPMNEIGTGGIQPHWIKDLKKKRGATDSSPWGSTNRAVNIDPGYVTLSKLVLATTKNYSHRIYIGSGIFEEITLYFKDQTFNPNLWTYPDYNSCGYITFFNNVRNIYRKQLQNKHELSELSRCV